MNKYAILFSWMLIMGMAAFAQSPATMLLNANSNGLFINPASNGTTLYDDGGQWHDYTHGYDYYIVINELEPSGNNVLRLTLESVDIAPLDTLYVYDGASTNAPLLAKLNNRYRSTDLTAFYPTHGNTSRKLTVRFRTANYYPAGETFGGFAIRLDYGLPCERTNITFDYEMLDMDGNLIRAGEPEATTHLNDQGQIVLGTPIVKGCIGQAIHLQAHAQYENVFGYYQCNTDDAWFRWEVTQGGETQVTNINSDVRFALEDPQHDVLLTVEDLWGCKLNKGGELTIVTTGSPIRTIVDLSTILNDNTLYLNASYEPGSYLVLKTGAEQRPVTRGNYHREFIPDGPKCPDKECVVKGIVFDQFADGDTISSTDQIASVCVNMEHSFMADLSISLRCPSYNEAHSQTQYMSRLKYGKNGEGSTSDPLAPADSPDGAVAGGGDDLGAPDYTTGDDACDTLQNPFGVGMNYCWSRNGNYTLVTGHSANTPDSLNEMYISNHANSVVMEVTYPIIYGGESLGTQMITTRTPSDPDHKQNYYRPADDFRNLIGCPLNGEWTLEICDRWGGDNGWLFYWDLELAKESYDEGANVERVEWTPDTNYQTDFVQGRYVGSGLRITPVDDQMSAWAEIGHNMTGSYAYNVNVSVFDDYGCQWDTNTVITTIRTLAIDPLAESNIVIRTTNQGIILTGTQQESLRIYDIEGRLIVNDKAQDDHLYPITHAGVYMVQLGNLPAHKVVIVK